ncbi:MAG: trans-sulfuration enzyme family protein [Planctomycetota bacterium]
MALRDVKTKQTSSLPNRGPSTLAVHAGETRQKLADSITDPICCAATYTFADTNALLHYVEHGSEREEYGRYGNPGERVVERKLAVLDGGEEAILFSTGMAAVVGVLMAKLSAGDEVILFDECYHRTREFCVKHLSRLGVVTHQVAACDYQAMEDKITPKTKLLISESPTNPHLSVVDLDRFVDIGRRHQVETLIDATLSTPYNLRPIECGVDYVLHSATKYLGGHNDLLAGVIVGGKDALESVRHLRGVMGSTNAPHNVYLLQRGLKTLELRMRRHNETGLAVAKFLESHPRVDRVMYPGLPTHPYHEVASRTMRGFGGLITFLVKDASRQDVSRIIDALQLPRIGPSLGGVESLIEQPVIMSYHECSLEDRQRFGIQDNMVRLSCGIEDTQDLIDDLKQALETE